MKLSCILAAALLVIGQPLAADQPPTREGTAGISKKEYSPYAGRSFPTQPFFGDTHLHTAVSVDAGTMCTVEQEEAFRFARGEEITTTHGLRAKLGRPLDFVVLTDHAEMYGLMPMLKQGDQTILAQPKGKQWYDALTSGNDKKVFETAMEIVGSLSGKEPPLKADPIVKKAWHKYTALADQYNEPGRFTALIGYEYTTMGGNNLHRNVVFRGDASVANQTLPFSQFDSQNPEDLWDALDAFQKKTGAEVLAIPHNGNLSNGRMFSVNQFDGTTPSARELAEQAVDIGLHIDAFVHATGSSGTQAGLVAGLAAIQSDIHLLGIGVRAPQERQEQMVFDLAQKTADHLGTGLAIPRDSVRANCDYVGGGYGVPTEGMKQAVKTLARTEGLLFDPVYSGKGLDGLIDLIGKGVFAGVDNVVFLHTGGSVALFGYPEVFDLPGYAD